MHYAVPSSTRAPVNPYWLSFSRAMSCFEVTAEEAQEELSSRIERRILYDCVRSPRDLEFPCGLPLLSVHSERTGILLIYQW